MTLTELLLHPGMRPFEIALGIVAGLLVLEIILNQLGGSLMGEIDSDLDADADLDTLGALDIDADTEIDIEGAAPTGANAASGLLSWFGLGHVPVMIWFAGVLTGFGIAGYLLQVGAVYVLGSPLAAWTAAGISAPIGAAFGARAARLIGKILPKHETSAVSRRSYGRRRGVISVGTARVGKPAQARFTDGHGNLHYAMVEPFEANDPLEQGTEIRIIRASDGALKAIRLSE